METTTLEATADYPHLSNVETQIWLYGSLPVLILGLFGNSFVIAIFSFSKSVKVRETTTARFLSVMAVSDCIFLLTGLLMEWLEQCGFITFNEINVYTCKIEKFLFYVSGDVSIWILCAFNFDRAFAVSRPLVKQRVSQKKHATWGILGILAAAGLKNMHVFWTRGAVYNDDSETTKNAGNYTVAEYLWNTTESVFITNVSDTAPSLQLDVDTLCGRPPQYANFENYIRPWIAFTLVNAIPFVFISICNVVIIVTLIRNKRQALTSTEKRLRQTIFMCLGVSLAFLVLVTPSMVLYIGRKEWTRTDSDRQIYDVVKAVSNLLTYLNHSDNFFMYCVTGKTFRLEFAYLIWKKRVDPRRTPHPREPAPARRGGTTTARQISQTSSGLT